MQTIDLIINPPYCDGESWSRGSTLEVKAPRRNLGDMKDGVAVGLDWVSSTIPEKSYPPKTSIEGKVTSGGKNAREGMLCTSITGLFCDRVLRS